MPDLTVTVALPDGADAETFAIALMEYCSAQGASAVASTIGDDLDDDALVHELARALRAVEYEYGSNDDADTLYCPWCRRRVFSDSGQLLDHRPDCRRQTSLAHYTAVYGEPEAAGEAEP